MESSEIVVAAGNVRYPHSEDYCLDRPAGHGQATVFIHCRTPCELGTSNGVVIARAGDCIVYAPGFPQYNRGIGEPLVNDWLHLEGQGVAKLLERHEISTNLCFRPADTRFIEPAILAMRREIYACGRGVDEALAYHASLFLLELGRQLNEPKDLKLRAGDLDQLTNFRKLRAKLQEAFAEPWTVSAMAEEVHLSRSRFSVLYRKIFGRPPLEDLLRTRLLHAQSQLFDGGLTVAEVAEQSGFESVIYFHRAFKKHFGDSPRSLAAGGLHPDKSLARQAWHHRE